MWKVSLNNYLQTLEFEFEQYTDAVAFVERAIKSSANMRATISFEELKREGEE